MTSDRQIHVTREAHRAAVVYGRRHSVAVKAWVSGLIFRAIDGRDWTRRAVAAVIELLAALEGVELPADARRHVTEVRRLLDRLESREERV